MTHILFITPYYPPEKAAPAVRISETAQLLVERGYRVTVLTTFPNYPNGVVPPQYRGRFIQKEVLDGVCVVRVWSYISPNKGFFRRVLAQLSFGSLAPLLGWKHIGRPDMLIAESPPLFDAIAVRLLAWMSHCPFIFVVSDLWPESAVQLGVLRNRTAIRLAEWLEWSTYHKAAAVWALTAGIRNALVQRGFAPERVFLLTNGVDLSKFRPMTRTQARAESGWDDRFTILYAGTHGLAHGLHIVLDAAEQLREHSDIRFVLAGDGATKAELVAQARQSKLENVTFLHPQPHERMPVLWNAADVCLVPARKIPLFEGALPSKMYEIMACARPMVLGVEGEARQLVEREAGAALYVEPENASALVAAIVYLHEHPEEAELLGRRGRAFVKARFDRRQLTSMLEARIAALLGKDAPLSTTVMPFPARP